LTRSPPIEYLVARSGLLDLELGQRFPS